MAAQIKVGTFTGRATNGDVAVTGVGFQPKLVIIMAAFAGAFDTFGDEIFYGLGISTGTTAAGFTRTNTVGAGWDGVATFQNITRRRGRPGEVISEITNPFGVSAMLGTMASLDSDGFTVTFQALVGGALEYTYIAIGGTGVSVKYGQVNWATSTGNQAITGVGFEPDLLLFSTGAEYLGAEGESTPGAHWGFGWVDSAGRQGVTAWHEEHSGTSNNNRYQRTTKCMAVLDSTSGAVAAEAEFVSFDADGFTVDWTTAHSAAAEFTYIALSGVFSHAGSLTQPTSSGDQSVSNLSISPLALLFQSAGAASSATVGTGLRYSLGAGSVGGNWSNWGGDEDGTNFAGRRTVRRFSDTAAVVHASPTGTATGSVLADASVSAVTEGGFTLDWASADATAREVLFLALGAEPVVIRGSAVFGETTTVTAPRAIAFGLDGNTNTHGEAGKFKVFGKQDITEDLHVMGDLIVDGSGGSGIDQLTGDVTAGPGSGSQAATIANDSVTYAKMQNVSAASRLLGRGSASGSGDPEEITVGSGLSLSGTTLSATGGGSGAIVQVVNTQTGAVATGGTVIPFDDSIPQNNEGEEYMTLAITPTDAANKLRIDVVAFFTPNAGNWITTALFQDSTANALAAFAGYQTVSTAVAPSTFTHWMTAGTTSSTTFKVRAGRDASAGTQITFNGQSAGRIFGGVMASSITITEIVP